jgi:hypothetical protein
MVRPSCQPPLGKGKSVIQHGRTYPPPPCGFGVCCRIEFRSGDGCCAGPVSLLTPGSLLSLLEALVPGGLVLRCRSFVSVRSALVWVTRGVGTSLTTICLWQKVAGRVGDQVAEFHGSLVLAEGCASLAFRCVCRGAAGRARPGPEGE